MKTKRIASRLNLLDEIKMKRILNHPTWREFIEATIRALENNDEIREVIKAEINKGREKC